MTSFSVVRVLPNVESLVPGTRSKDQKQKKNVFEYLVATANYSGLIRLWQIQVDANGDRKCKCVGKLDDGKSKGKVGNKCNRRVRRYLCAHLKYCPDGRLASGSTDGTVRLWNLSANTCTVSLDCGLNNIWSICALGDATIPVEPRCSASR